MRIITRAADPAVQKLLERCVQAAMHDDDDTLLEELSKIVKKEELDAVRPLLSSRKFRDALDERETEINNIMSGSLMCREIPDFRVVPKLD
jgi:hypothetical protein